MLVASPAHFNFHEFYHTEGTRVARVKSPCPGWLLVTTSVEPDSIKGGNMTFTITDAGAYKCTECDKESPSQLAHHSHYRRHKNAAAKTVVVQPASTTRSVVAPPVVAPAPASQPTPAPQPVSKPKGRSWFNLIMYGSDD